MRLFSDDGNSFKLPFSNSNEEYSDIFRILKMNKVAGYNLLLII